MKIRLSELRKIINEICNVDEESGVPGKWNASSGESADEDDLQRLGEADEEDYSRVKSTRVGGDVRRLEFLRQGRKAPAAATFANNDYDEPVCMDCGLPGSDCDCSPSGRFE